jgi:hypothetical protein
MYNAVPRKVNNVNKISRIGMIDTTKLIFRLFSTVFKDTYIFPTLEIGRLSRVIVFDLKY